MTSRLLAVLGAAAIIAALPGPALAADASHDDAIRPDGAAATWTTGVDRTPVITPDVVYPGPHQAIVKTLAPRAPSAVLSMDDTIYPEADTPAPVGAPERTARADARPSGADARLACECARD